MDLFASAEDAYAAAVMDTISAARKAGFTHQVNDDGHVLCAMPDTARLIDVFPDGSWEYQDVLDDGEMDTMSGDSALMLALYLHGDNAAMFKKLENEA